MPDCQIGSDSRIVRYRSTSTINYEYELALAGQEPIAVKFLESFPIGFLPNELGAFCGRRNSTGQDGCRLARCRRSPDDPRDSARAPRGAARAALPRKLLRDD